MIIVAPDARLKRPSDPIDFEAPQRDLWELERTLVRQLWSLEASGLAAPQVGIPLRAFAIHFGGRPEVCLNPQIDEAHGQMSGPEGCLSYPGIYPVVRRAREILVSYWTPLGVRRARRLRDLEARCFAHEVDHLDGVLLEDRASAQSMMMARMAVLRKRR